MYAYCFVYSNKHDDNRKTNINNDTNGSCLYILGYCR